MGIRLLRFWKLYIYGRLACADTWAFEILILVILMKVRQIFWIGFGFRTNNPYLDIKKVCNAEKSQPTSANEAEANLVGKKTFSAFDVSGNLFCTIEVVKRSHVWFGQRMKISWMDLIRFCQIIGVSKLRRGRSCKIIGLACSQITSNSECNVFLCFEISIHWL